MEDSDGKPEAPAPPGARHASGDVEVAAYLGIAQERENAQRERPPGAAPPAPEAGGDRRY